MECNAERAWATDGYKVQHERYVEEAMHRFEMSGCKVLMHKKQMLVSKLWASKVETRYAAVLDNLL